jgi:hypothetical protein
LTNDSRYKAHAKETAICVEMAFNTMEEDIKNELATATAPTADALRRVLEKMRERRKTLEQFTRAA